MKWSIAWSAVAERYLLSLPWRLAARVGAAVMAFAEGRSGEGSVERIIASDPYRLRLRLRGASAFLWLDGGTKVVNVARVLRTM